MSYAKLSSLTVVDIVNELESAPEAKVKETVAVARKLLSSSLNKLSNAVKPENKTA